MNIKKIFEVSSLAQIRGLYGFVWIQIISNILIILHTDKSLPTTSVYFTYKLAIAALLGGIYIVLITRPSKLISVLRLENSSTLQLKLEVKFMSLIFIIIGGIILGYC